jgi:hypothetical protein
MEEKRRRKGREDDSRSSYFEKVSFGHLFQTISTDPTDKQLVRYVRMIEQIREDRQDKPTDPTLERAEKTLFQLIRQRGDPSDITLQAGTVESLRAAIERSKSSLTFALSRNDSLTRHLQSSTEAEKTAKNAVSRVSLPSSSPCPRPIH